MGEYYNTQLINVAWQYANVLDVKVTKTTLQKEIRENPHFPALLSISRTFSKYNIPNNAFRVNIQEFKRFKPPFLALLKIRGMDNDFVLVTETRENSITYIYEKNKKIKVSADDFFSNFQDIVWLASPGSQSGEENYQQQLRLEKIVWYKKISLIAGILFIFISIVCSDFTSDWLSFVIALLLKLAGCIIASLLLLYEIDRNNVLLKNICKANENKQSSCDAVLMSKASKIFGINLGEIVFFYFSGTTLLLLLPVLSFQIKLAWLSIINICALPFVLYSLFYQWRVIKRWCKLCMSTAAIVLFEFIVFIFFFWKNSYLPNNTLSDLCLIGSVFLFPIISWVLLKPTLLKARDANLYYFAYLRLKNNPDIFSYELQKQVPILAGWENLGLTIGNPEGSNIIVDVSDPFCPPCSYTHDVLNGWIQQNKKLQVHMLFFNQNVAADKGGVLVKHLLAIAEKSNNRDTKQALKDWYMNRNYNEFAKKYPMSEEEIECSGPKLEEMYTWCVTAQVKFTPTLFVNGYQLPENYSLNDLKNII